jgi:hypothetical protein
MIGNTAGMIEHLSLISQATAKDRQALVIVWHMTKAIRCFSNVTLLPLPPYSQILSMALVSMVKYLKELEVENAQFKRMYVQSELKLQIAKDALANLVKYHIPKL